VGFPCRHPDNAVAGEDVTLLMVGTFGDPQREGSMAVFTSHDAAERFATGDPFVLQGVVSRWSIREWNEALSTL
jgi:uncharacterized protein